MSWWAYHWPPKFYRLFTIICLYVILSDLFPIVCPQSMFSWTPIIKHSKKPSRSNTKYNVHERNFLLHNGMFPLQPVSKSSRDNSHLRNANAKKPFFGALGMHSRKEARKNSLLVQKGTQNEKIVTVPYSLENQKSIYTNLGSIGPEVFEISDVKVLDKDKKNYNYSNIGDKLSSISDKNGYLTWKSIERQSEIIDRVSSNPNAKGSNGKRIKKNVKVDKRNVNKANSPSANSGNENLKTIRTFSTELFDGANDRDINQTHIIDAPPTFVGLVMVNSDMAIITKGNHNETEEKRIENNKM